VELFHALNRGVEKRTLFLDDQDRARFVHDMYEFNDTAPAGNSYRRFKPMMESRSPSIEKCREMIVDIYGWCLMDNHYHLLLSEKVAGGVGLFLKKLNIGYAMYFNEKYERSGTLFQGRTKKVLIDSDAHFLHILHYIHLNPLDFLEGSSSWREMLVTDAAKAVGHLGAYRWSSYNDYCGRDNFPSIISQELYGSVFKDYEKIIKKYLSDIQIAPLKPLLLE